jgi:AcrR family transcriptional regulator
MPEAVMGTAKKDLLLRTGVELFGRYGYRDVSVTDVTRAAGIGTGSFYSWFTSKEAFYEEVLDMLEQEGVRLLQERLAGLSSPMGKLKVLLHFATLGIRHQPILRGFVTGDRKFVHPGRQERLRRQGGLRATVETRIGELIREGSQKGEFRSRLFRNPAAAVMALFEAALLHIDDRDAETLTADLVLLIQRGLGRRIRLRPTGQIRDLRIADRLRRG